MLIHKYHENAKNSNLLKSRYKKILNCKNFYLTYQKYVRNSLRTDILFIRKDIKIFS